MDTFVLGMLNGISFGFILFLLASGLSLILGVMGILNLAHGALYMIGAFAGWSVAENLGLPILVGGCDWRISCGGSLGCLIERGLFRYLHNQLNEQVLVSFGLVFILTNVVQWVWGPIPRGQYTADILSGSVNLGGYTYPNDAACDYRGRIGTWPFGSVVAARPDSDWLGRASGYG